MLTPQACIWKNVEYLNIYGNIFLLLTNVTRASQRIKRAETSQKPKHLDLIFWQFIWDISIITKNSKKWHYSKKHEIITVRDSELFWDFSLHV